MKKYIKADLDTGLVGLWWIYDDKVIGCAVPLDDGEDDRGFVQYSCTKNHLTEWSKVVTEQLPKSEQFIINKGYRSIERGRVVYNIRAHVYEIICSEAVANNKSQIQSIVDEFQLNGERYDVITDSHYRVFELTGNPALDNFEW